MDKEKLHHYFTSWELSLFQLREERVGKLKIRGIESVEYLEEKNFEATTILLKKENEGSTSKYFNDVLKEDPDNIHAWCNKGMYHLRKRPVELREAQEAREKMEALMRLEGPTKEAKVETAYWLHQRDGSEEAREKAYELFKSVEQLTVSQNALYLQVLTADIKRVRQTKEENKRLFATFASVSEQILGSKDDQHILGVWLSFSDVIVNHHYRAAIKRGDATTPSIANLAGCDEEEMIRFCLEKLTSMQDRPSVHLRSNFYAKLTKLHRFRAENENNAEKRKELFQIGLKAAQNFQNVPESSFDQAPRMCAKMLLGIWAVEYHGENRELVERDYQEKHMTTNSGSPPHLWKHLAIDYYGTAPDTSPTTRHWLEKALKYLEEYKTPTKNYFIPEYPRVLMLLGKPQEDVEKALERMSGGQLEEADSSVSAHQGLYYETIGEKKKAELYYKQAVKHGGHTHRAINMAERGLKRFSTPFY